MKTFAERLKFAMAEANLNQSSLAEKSGASKAAISQYLSGKNTPSSNRMKILADITGVSVDFLMGDAEDPPKVVPMPHKRITVEIAAACLGRSRKFVMMGLQRGRLPIGTAFIGTGTKYEYDIRPEMLRDYVGAQRFNEFFQLTVCPVCGGTTSLSVCENVRTQDSAPDGAAVKDAL